MKKRHRTLRHDGHVLHAFQGDAARRVVAKHVAATPQGLYCPYASPKFCKPDEYLVLCITVTYHIKHHELAENLHTRCERDEERHVLQNLQAWRNSLQIPST